MSYDNEWLDQTLDARRKSVRETIRPATLEELQALGTERFPIATDPWAENYRNFLTEHPRDHYYLGKTHEGAEVVYCREAGRAIWFLPGKGMGIVQPRGLKILAEAVASL
jgi:hypothetical protein